MELLVVIGIFIVITGLLLANFRQRREADAVRIAALRLAADVERMQTAARVGGASGERAVAYGIHFDTAHASQYVLFGDRVQCRKEGAEEICRSNGRYDADGDPDEVLLNGIIELPERVVVAMIAPQEAASASLDVLFEPPRARVAIEPEATIATITLRHTTIGDERTVSINRISGQVSVE